MTKNSTCPDHDVFVDFLCGKLAEDRLRNLEIHLSTCDACGDTIRDMNVDDTFINLLSTGGGLPHDDNEHADIALLDLMEKLESLAETSSLVSQDTTCEEDLQSRVHEVESLLSKPASDEEIGRLGHYRILKLLGAGGMGVVYQAEDSHLKRLVALKILRPSLGRAARDRFIQEARAAAAIEHDNIVTIYNVGSEGPLAFLAMQHLDGETLESRLKRDNRLSDEEVIQIGSQIADGLAAAHDQKLIHRDIKPANILISADRNRATILDFGLAYAIDDDPELTETGMIAGTPAYMSPEQARGQSIDERSDLFSLGTIMYRMLTGTMPFSGSNALATIRSIQKNMPPAPRQVDMGTPAALSDTVMDLLEKDPRCRPNDARAVADALRNRTRPPKSRLPESASTAANRGSGNRRWLVASALAFAGLMAAAMIYTIQTDNGQITVKTDDPNIQVKVLQSGELIKIIDPNSNDTVSVRSGTYQLHLKDPSSEATISPKEVTLKRNGQRTVTISKLPAITADGSKSASERTAKDLYIKAQELRKRGDAAKAVPLLHAILSRLKSDLLARIELARCYEALGERDRAIDTYSYAIDLGSAEPRPEWIFERGRVYESVNSYKKAFDDFDQAYALDPSNNLYSKARNQTRKLIQEQQAEQAKLANLIQPGDQIYIKVVGTIPEQPIDGIYVVEPAGTVPLGPIYGRANVAELTMNRAEQAIRDTLRKTLTMPEVMVTKHQHLRQANITLTAASAEAAARMFRQLHPNSRLQIEPDVNTNSLLVAAHSDAELAQLTEYLQQIESPTNVTSNPKSSHSVDADSVSGGKLYDGRPFQYWRNAIRMETKKERVIEAMQAMEHLMSEMNSRSVCEAVFEAMRRFGIYGFIIDNQGHFTHDEAANAAASLLGRCKPQDVAEQMIQEFGTDGNQKSRDFIRRYWATSLWVQDTQNTTELWDILTKHGEYFWNRASEMDSGNPDSTWAIETQTLFASRAHKSDKDFPLGDEEIALIEQEMLDPIGTGNSTAAWGWSTGFGANLRTNPLMQFRRLIAARALAIHAPQTPYQGVRISRACVAGGGEGQFRQGWLVFHRGLCQDTWRRCRVACADHSGDYSQVAARGTERLQRRIRSTPRNE